MTRNLQQTRRPFPGVQDKEGDIMATRKFAKTLVFSLASAIFLSLLITNWDALKSVRWRDLFETSKNSGIGEFLKQNAGDIFFFGLCVSFIFLLLWNYIDVNVRTLRRRVGMPSIINGEDALEITDQSGGRLVNELDIDISIDPGLSSMPSNVYHRWHADHQPKKDEP
jgi:hypothetical protein